MQHLQKHQQITNWWSVWMGSGRKGPLPLWKQLTSGYFRRSFMIVNSAAETSWLFSWSAINVCSSVESNAAYSVNQSLTIDSAILSISLYLSHTSTLYLHFCIKWKKNQFNQISILFNFSQREKKVRRNKMQNGYGESRWFSFILSVRRWIFGWFSCVIRSLYQIELDNSNSLPSVKRGEPEKWWKRYGCTVYTQTHKWPSWHTWTGKWECEPPKHALQINTSTHVTIEEIQYVFHSRFLDLEHHFSTTNSVSLFFFKCGCDTFCSVLCFCHCVLKNSKKKFAIRLTMPIVDISNEHGCFVYIHLCVCMDVCMRVSSTSFIRIGQPQCSSVV